MTDDPSRDGRALTMMVDRGTFSLHGEQSMSFRLRTAIVASVVLAQLWTAGCGESDPDDTGTGGATSGVGGSTSGVGGVKTGGSAGMPAAAGRAGSGAAGMGGLSAGGSAGGSGSGGKAAGGSSGGSSGAAGGGNAPDCYPPCLWDLFANCRPTTSCIQDDNPASSSDFVRCEAATGWYVDATFDADGTHPDPDLLVTVNGQTCLTGTYVEPTWRYQDPSGTVVATVTIESEGFFGRCPLLETPGEDPVIYPVDDEDPRCAGIACTPGTCP